VFKGSIYIPTLTAGQFQKWDMAMTAQVLTNTNFYPDNQSGIGKNRNVVITSTSSGSGTELYFTWNMVTATSYVVGASPNSTISYIGSNIFQVKQWGGAEKSFLLYVPVTVGAPTILKQLPDGIELFHINNTLIQRKNLVLSTAGLAARPDDPDTSLADAQAYADALVNVLTYDMTAFFTDPGPYKRIALRWGNRFVSSSNVGIRIWDVN
jgi:hypothetical protein